MQIYVKNNFTISFKLLEITDKNPKIGKEKIMQLHRNPLSNYNLYLT